MSFFVPDIFTDPFAFERANWIAECCTVSACTVTLYDHLCTLPQEMKLIWGREFNSVILLFHVNRWANTLYAVVYFMMLSCFDLSKSCDVLNGLYQICVALEFVVWAVLSALRIFAVSRGNRRLTFLVGALSFLPAGMSFYTLFISSWKQISDSATPAIRIACFTTTYLAEYMMIDLTIATRFSVIAFDFIVLLIIWSNTLDTRKNAAHNGIKTPLATMLVRDGGIYFLVLMSLNVLQLAGIFAKDAVVAAMYFRNPLSAVILSHFLLNLRGAAHESLDDSDYFGRRSVICSRYSKSITSQSEMQFATFVANIGADLIHDSDAEDAELEWLSQNNDNRDIIPAKDDADIELGFIQRGNEELAGSVTVANYADDV